LFPSFSRPSDDRLAEINHFVAAQTFKSHAARVKVKTKVIGVKPKKALAVDFSRVIFAFDLSRVKKAFKSFWLSI
jgi:hypothetical protein